MEYLDNFDRETIKYNPLTEAPIWKIKILWICIWNSQFCSWQL